MDTVNPILDAGIRYVVGIEIGEAKPDGTVFRIAYKNKISANINSVGF